MSVAIRALPSVSSREQLEDENCAQLIWKIAGGDSSSFDLLYDDTSGLVFGLLLLLLDHTAAAEEVLAEVYAEVRQGPAQFKERQESSLRWLIHIC